MNVLAGNGSASVDHFDFDAAVVGGGAHFEHAAGGHGVASVQEQIKKDLLQFVGGAAHGRKRLAQLFDNVNLRSFERMGDEGKSFLDYAIDVDIGKFGGAGARKIQKIVYDFAGPEGLLHDLIDDVVPGIIFRHLLGEHLNVVGDDGERRIDFVGHASGEKAERGEFFCLAHLLFHALALGDIVEQKQAADALAGFAHQRSDGDIEREVF